MTWLNLVSGLVGLAKRLAGLLRDRQLIKAGEDRAVSAMATKALDMVRRANAARRAMSHTDDSVRDDKFNRDA